MKRGFTLLELIIVVIILGILIAIAIPQFVGTRLRAYSAEALNMLGATRSSQIRYYEANDSTWDNTVGCSGLDITVAGPQYNLLPNCSGAGNAMLGGDIEVAFVADNVASGVYSLKIGRNGDVECTGADCSDIGY